MLPHICNVMKSILQALQGVYKNSMYFLPILLPENEGHLYSSIIFWLSSSELERMKCLRLNCRFTYLIDLIYRCLSQSGVPASLVLPARVSVPV